MKKRRAPMKRTPNTPKRLKQFGRARPSKKERILTIDASPENDASVLPVKINGGMTKSEHDMLTPDRLAEEVGGRSELVNMCRLSEAKEAMEFVRKCEMDKDVSLDNILASMNCKLGVILASVVPAMCEYGGQVGRLMRALKSPALMRNSLHVALTGGVDSYPERRMHLEMAGLVDKQRGTMIVGQLNTGQGGGVERPEATFLQRVDDDNDE